MTDKQTVQEYLYELGSEERKVEDLTRVRTALTELNMAVFSYNASHYDDDLTVTLGGEEVWVWVNAGDDEAPVDLPKERGVVLPDPNNWNAGKTEKRKSIKEIGLFPRSWFASVNDVANAFNELDARVEKLEGAGDSE